MTATLDEIKGMLEAQQAEVSRRLADADSARARDHAAIVVRLDSQDRALRTLTQRIDDVEERTTDVERNQQTSAGYVRKALDSVSDLEQRAVKEFITVAAQLEEGVRQREEQKRMLEAQDRVIAAVKADTEKHTPLLERLIEIEDNKAAVVASDRERAAKVAYWVKLAIAVATLAGIVSAALKLIH